MGLSFLLISCGERGGDDPGEIPPVPLESRAFDCRGEATVERRSEVPLDCIVDPACEERLVVGHRGTGGEVGLFTPENSLASIRLAILMGLDAVELDVRHTIDEGLVLMHDGSLERTTGDLRQVTEVTLAEATALPLLVEGYPGQFDCERVPTFEAALALAKGRINIDVDTKTDRADLVAAALRDADMLGQAFVSTPSPAAATLARAAVPEVMIQARPTSMADYLADWSVLGRSAEVVEVDVGQAAEFEPIVHGGGGKLFVNAFLQDAVVLIDGDLEYYLDTYGENVDLLQSEFPHWVLEALGRTYWSAWPDHRDPGVESPLLP